MQSITIANGDAFRLGIIGDLHTYWDEVDLRQFSQSDYDLLYFVGDLGGGTPASTLRVARLMARLQQPTLVMPGNNDTMDINALAAELALQNGVSKILAITGSPYSQPSEIALCGYSVHRIQAAGIDVGLIAARPHSMGGPNLSFPDYMWTSYGIDSLEQSEQRLKQLVDSSDCQQLIFLAHNGPHGLGEEPHDIWGCDFKSGGGDWGDRDLSAAISYARAQGKTVLAVIAGHMHLHTRQGRDRPWLEETGGTLYVNSARVPRIFADKKVTYRHHVAMTITAAGVAVEQVLLPESGS